MTHHWWFVGNFRFCSAPQKFNQVINLIILLIKPRIQVTHTSQFILLRFNWNWIKTCKIFSHFLGLILSVILTKPTTKALSNSIRLRYIYRNLIFVKGPQRHNSFEGFETILDMWESVLTDLFFIERTPLYPFYCLYTSFKRFQLTVMWFCVNAFYWDQIPVFLN